MGTCRYRGLDPILARYRDKTGNLIPILHEVQDKIGYLPEDVQAYVSDYLNVPFSKVYGVVTFYSYFSTMPKGKHTLGVCMGTACYVKGGEKILAKLQGELGIKTGETTDDGLFTLTITRCVGTCSMAPVVMIDEKVYGKLTEKEIPNILGEYSVEEN